MDSLRFDLKEHFDTFDYFMSLSEDDSQSTEDALNKSANINYWDWEKEEMINGDVAVIPTSYVGTSIESSSPPIKEDFQKIMSDWQQLVNFETEDVKDFVMEMDMMSSEQLGDQTEPFNILKNSPSFDLADFIDNKTNESKKVQRGGKKIDLMAQCYVVDGKKEENEFVVNTGEDIRKNIGCVEEDDHIIDVETISEPRASPILQAQDVSSLLEIFEAEFDQFSDKGNKEEDPQKQLNSSNKNYITNCSELSLNSARDKSNNVKNLALTIEKKNNEQIENFTADASNKINSLIRISEISAVHAPVPTNNKQIIDELPTELINRIKASSKRRSIAIIDFIPNTKRIKTTQKNNAKYTSQENNQNASDSAESYCPSPDWVQLDHDYCSSLSPYTKYQKKDSGFESAEEDEQRNILKNQPTVKRADGKLMVSLLKINTIKRNIANSTEAQKKRKLNLEEYKKRREGVLKSYECSQNSSPLSSGRCSPTIDDENIRRLKHQEKLLQMAAELLKSSPKSKKNENSIAESASSACLVTKVKTSNVNKTIQNSSLDKTTKNPNASKTTKNTCVDKTSKIPNPDITIKSPKKEKLEKNMNISNMEYFKNNVKSSEIEKNKKTIIIDMDRIKKEKCLSVVKNLKTEESGDTNEEWKNVSFEQINIPSNYIAKTIVSIGVNTEFIKIPFRKNKQMDVPPIKQLEEIKPILEIASGKINSNSLIASVIENIQNKIKSATPIFNNQVKIEVEETCGEDRTIVYLPKIKHPIKTRDVALQTDFAEDWIDLTIENLPLNNGNDTKSKTDYKKERKRSREHSRDGSSRSSSNDSRYSGSSKSSRSGSTSPQRFSIQKRPTQINKDHLRAVEERRIVYVGGISSRTTREDLRHRFQKFGPITNISIHFRDYGDNYGFVTFLYNVDAYEAVEHGNDDPNFPQYDLSFGGRRIFCRTRYSDLDNIHEDSGYAPMHKNEDSFDSLLREMQAKLCKRKMST